SQIGTTARQSAPEPMPEPVPRQVRQRHALTLLNFRAKKCKIDSLLHIVYAHSVCIAGLKTLLEDFRYEYDEQKEH
ncbi:MAG: hypothetical protein WCL54_06335, partial [Clostridia bacterium]